MQTYAHSVSPTRPRYIFTAFSYFVSDALALIFAAWAGGQLWHLVNYRASPEVFYSFWPILLMFPLVFSRASLYTGGGLNPVVEFSRLANLTTVVYITALLVSFLLSEATFSRGAFLSSWSLSLVLLPLGRHVLRQLFAHQPWWGTPVVILGTGRVAALVAENLLENPESGFKPVACFGQLAGARTLRGVPLVGPLASATAWAKEQGVTHAVVAMPEVQSETLLQIIQDHTEAFPKLIFVSQFFGRVGLSISRREFGSLLGLQIQRNLLLASNRFLKRTMDLVVGLPLFLLALPVIALAALAIALVSPGSPFYYQLREGYKGREVRVWKLRTMYLDAEERLEKMLADNPSARAEWEQFYKLKNDPRILPGVGHLLRKVSFDELPQLYNVLLGQMSLVGPRPFPYYHLEQFDQRFRDLRQEVLPGITGLWQVSKRSDGDLAVQEDLDSYYIRDWSLWFDVYLLARTPWAVLFGKGAY